MENLGCLVDVQFTGIIKRQKDHRIKEIRGGRQFNIPGLGLLVIGGYWNRASMGHVTEDLARMRQNMRNDSFVRWGRLYIRK